MRTAIWGLWIAALLGAGAVAGTIPRSSLTGARVVADTGFVLSGEAESPQGATWTFRDTVGGVWYDLSGVLLKPKGSGPFPAVILSHGFEGNAALFSRIMGPVMVGWGLVVIAPNYTHASGVPIGAPGGASEPGASEANVLRAHMTYALLARLGYVDLSRVALHGHSMGAYLGVAVAGTFPRDFRVASQTGGGIRPDRVRAGPAPTAEQARGIRTPFQMHHGESDATVPVDYDVRFAQVLSGLGVEHQLHTYPGKGHLQVRADPVVLSRIHDWYAAHGMFTP
ncbi:MAG TPA: prolyl oligopeptidase family serine peptidase [Gemmatimonadales bacterium]|jgi:dienelactone hydrolase